LKKKDDENPLESLKARPGDDNFLAAAFTAVSKYRKKLKKVAASKSVCAEEYDNLSKRVDRSKLQESCSVRNILKTRRIAETVIDENGELLPEEIDKILECMKEHCYSLGIDRQYDTRRNEQIISVLDFLKENREAVRLLKNIGKPHAHRQAEQIIRDTLGLANNTVVTDAHARQATLAAWMCYLRQNVGSCFATAPAIIVHDEQPIQFLKDINELLSTGRLKRTFGGIEYIAPLSATWGAGDLKRNFLMRNENEEIQPEIWLSPALMDALEAMHLIDREEPLKNRIEQLKERLKPIFEKLKAGSYAVYNTEQILNEILYNHLNINEQDLKDYANRTRGMIQSSFVFQSPQTARGSGGKGESCAQYYVLLDLGERAFKGMADNALLKSWEFTLASFAETKAEFTKWNLYSSLGFDPQEKDGIGYCIYQIVKKRLDRSNQRVQDLQLEYEQQFNQLKQLEVRLKRASTEKEVHWLTIEYRSRRNEFESLEEMRDRENRKAHQIASLHQELTDVYYELFQRYFQEVYDADLHEVSIGPYDDSPAGFRLLYKHGRANTSQWTYIKDQHQYIEALTGFFTATESEVESRDEFKGLQQELSEIITAIVLHIKSKEFLESSLFRMAAVHRSRIPKDPLDHLDLVEKKPWAYTSGGTMGSLVSCYFGLESKPTESGRWVENPTELLVFLLDTLKQIPQKTITDMVKEGRRSLLIHSPTHAFLLKPFVNSFFKTWQDESYTYTWVRDSLIKPQDNALEMIQIDDQMARYFIEKLSVEVPLNYKHYYFNVFANMYGTWSTTLLRQHIVEEFETQRGLQVQGRPVVSSADVDSLLYSLLPLFPVEQLRERVKSILENITELPKGKVKECMSLFDQLDTGFREIKVSDAKNLRETCKGLICLALKETSTEIDYESKIVSSARSLGYALPQPIHFADTNWVQNDFAFVVNPGTRKLEFWRVDPLGVTGVPMIQWEEWLNGSRKDITWGVYTRPYEYVRK
jgi:hypothetical protein